MYISIYFTWWCLCWLLLQQLFLPLSNYHIRFFGFLLLHHLRHARCNTRKGYQEGRQTVPNQNSSISLPTWDTIRSNQRIQGNPLPTTTSSLLCQQFIPQNQPKKTWTIGLHTSYICFKLATSSTICFIQTINLYSIGCKLKGLILLLHLWLDVFVFVLY